MNATQQRRPGQLCWEAGWLWQAEAGQNRTGYSRQRRRREQAVRRAAACWTGLEKLAPLCPGDPSLSLKALQGDLEAPPKTPQSHPLPLVRLTQVAHRLAAC